jgi:two-component system KDP operon response regulator KdpE
VVDDDGSTRLLVRAVLESHGWTVLEAATGAEALVEIGRGRGLSLIVLDLGLPDLDGRDVLRTAKRSMDTAGTPVIVLTGSIERETERILLMEGAEDYIRKPFDAAIFLTRAKAVMRRVKDI